RYQSLFVNESYELNAVAQFPPENLFRQILFHRAFANEDEAHILAPVSQLVQSFYQSEDSFFADNSAYVEYDLSVFRNSSRDEVWLAIAFEPGYFDSVWDNVDPGIDRTEFVLDMVEHVVAATDDSVALLYQWTLDVAHFPATLKLNATAHCNFR